MGAPPLENQAARRNGGDGIVFGYLFSRLWKNPLSRFIFLGAIVFITFGLIYSARHGLYKYLSRVFSSPDWSEVVRYGSRPFAFEENESKAHNLTETAWKEIHTLAVKKLGIKDAKEALSASVRPRPYSTFLYRSAEEHIFTFFNALKDNCGELMVSTNIADRTDAAAELAKEMSATGKVSHHLRMNMYELLRINATLVEAALQKKPDYVPAIELSEEIFRATCSLREIPPVLARAMDYREYVLQKQLYDADNGKLYEKNPELFHIKSTEAYAKDPAYRDFFSRYFDATKHRTPYDPAHLKNVQTAYARLQNVKTLEALIAALLAEARNSTPLVAKKCHFELFALDYPGISDRPDYVFALAETAVRGDELARAQKIVANALASRIIRDDSMLRDFERLRFHIDLMRHDSENISRF